MEGQPQPGGPARTEARAGDRRGAPRQAEHIGQAAASIPRLASLLSVPEDEIPARLLANAEQDPLPAVRHLAAVRLLALHPGREAARCFGRPAEQAIAAIRARIGPVEAGRLAVADDPEREGGLRLQDQLGGPNWGGASQLRAKTPP